MKVRKMRPRLSSFILPPSAFQFRLALVKLAARPTRRSPVFSKWPIRVKLLVGLGLLVVMVAILSGSGLYTTYAYRNLVKSLSWRVSELPAGRRGEQPREQPAGRR